MNPDSDTGKSKRTSAFWRMSLALLLLCGITSYTSTSSRSHASYSDSTFTLELNKIVFGGNADCLRVRADAIHKDIVPSDGGDEGPLYICASCLTLLDGSSDTSEYSLLPTLTFGVSKYLLESPRAPPMA